MFIWPKCPPVKPWQFYGLIGAPCLSQIIHLHQLPESQHAPTQAPVKATRHLIKKGRIQAWCEKVKNFTQPWVQDLLGMSDFVMGMRWPFFPLPGIALDGINCLSSLDRFRENIWEAEKKTLKNCTWCTCIACPPNLAPLFDLWKVEGSSKGTTIGFLKLRCAKSMSSHSSDWLGLLARGRISRSSHLP